MFKGSPCRLPSFLMMCLRLMLSSGFCLSFVSLSMWKNGIIRARNKNDDIKGNNYDERQNRKETRESQRECRSPHEWNRKFVISDFFHFSLPHAVGFKGKLLFLMS